MSDYWKKRALEREEYYQKNCNKAVKQVQRIYDKAFKDIQDEISSIEKQLKIKGLDSSDKEAYLFRLQQKLKLEEDIYDKLVKLGPLERKITESHYKNLIIDSFTRTMFDIQKGTGYGFSFSIPSEKVLKQVIETNWKGRNFSTSIWKNTHILANKAKDIISSGFATGIHIENMTSDLMIEKLHNLKKNAWYVSERLIRTEVNFFANQGELLSYQECEVEFYEYLATLDNRTSELCQKQDGKIYKISEAEVGVNYPPLHAFCRSTTVARFEGDTLEGLKRRARNEDGETYLIDADVNYEEWKDKYVLHQNHKRHIIKSSIQCKTFNQFSSHILNKYGVSVDFSLKELDIRALTESATGVEIVLDDFPSAKKHFSGFSSHNSGIMACSYDGEIYFNPKYYKTYEQVEIVSNSSNGFHPKNTGVLDNGTHECGHILELTLIKTNPKYQNKIMQIDAWENCTEAKAVVLEACKLAKKMPEGKSLLNFDLKKNISEYALKDDSECLAEGVSDFYRNKENAQILSKMIYKLLKERLGG